MTIHPLKNRFEILRRETLYHPKSYEISSLSFNDNGNYLIIGGNDGTLHIWNIPYINSYIACNINNFENEYIKFKKLQCRHITSKKCHFAPISSLTIQDKMIITSSWDGNIVIWSLLQHNDDGIIGHNNLKYFEKNHSLDTDDSDSDSDSSDDSDEKEIQLFKTVKKTNVNANTKYVSNDPNDKNILFYDSNVIIPIMRIEKPAQKISTDGSMHTSVLMAVALPNSSKYGNNANDGNIGDLSSNNNSNQLPPYLLFGARNSKVGIINIIDELMKSHSKFPLENIKLGKNIGVSKNVIDYNKNVNGLNVVNATELNKIEKHFWDILNGWYNIWNDGSAILSAVSTMAKPVLKLLKKDKIEYEKITKSIKTDVSNNNGNGNKDVNSKNNTEYEYFIKIKKETELIENDITSNVINSSLNNNNVLKQDSINLNKIRKDAIKIQKKLTEFAQRLAKESFIDGMYVFFFFLSKNLLLLSLLFFVCFVCFVCIMMCIYK